MSLVKDLLVTFVTIFFVVSYLYLLKKISRQIYPFAEIEQLIEDRTELVNVTIESHLLPSSAYYIFTGWLLSASSSTLLLWIIALMVIFLFASTLFINTSIAVAIAFIWCSSIAFYWIINFNSGAIDANWLAYLNSSFPMPKQYAIVLVLFALTWMLCLTTSLTIPNWNIADRKILDISRIDFRSLFRILLMLIAPCYLSLGVGHIINLLT